jgi:hypothetical protein
MSLINEALKKAQRLRQEEPASGSPASESAPADRVIKRSPPKSTHTMVLLVAGGVVLVVLSVVVTVFLLNRPSDAPAPPVAGLTPEAPVLPPTITPEIRPPVIAAIEPSPAASAALETPPPAAAPVIVAATPSEPVPVAPPVPPAAPQPDPRVTAFVEAIRVAGIRSSGDESRVLMNERVYRVNDLVDRTLNVRLTKVETDTLTFADANGISYVKKF